MIRTYTELNRLRTLEERFEYLRLDGDVACPTFGSARWMNQGFYRSKEWRQVRQAIIYRDNGCDLGIDDFEIHSRATIHHLNPITEDHIINRSPLLLDPENLITTTHNTHNAIHYGDRRLLPQPLVERYEGDTKDW